MTVLSIPEMSCGHCKATIEKTILVLDPTAAMDFDMPGRTVNVNSDLPVTALRTALRASGYEAI